MKKIIKKQICKMKGHEYKFSHVEPDGWGLYNWHWQSCKRCGHSFFDKVPVNKDVTP